MSYRDRSFDSSSRADRRGGWVTEWVVILSILLIHNVNECTRSFTFIFFSWLS